MVAESFSLDTSKIQHRQANPSPLPENRQSVGAADSSQWPENKKRPANGRVHQGASIYF